MATKRFRDALYVTKRLFKQQGSHRLARSYVVSICIYSLFHRRLFIHYQQLAAKIYFSHVDPTIRIKSKQLLENALEKEPYYTEAVLMMIDLLLESNDNASAEKLIKKQVIVKPSSTLFSILGDIARKENNPMEAVLHYTSALNMDPQNRPANAGLLALNGSPEDTEDNQMQEFGEMSEAPTNAVNSETDAPWPDFETGGR